MNVVVKDRLTRQRLSSTSNVIGIECISDSAKHHLRLTDEFGRGGELASLQHTDAPIEALHPALQQGEFLLKLNQQRLELIGGFGNAIQTSIEQGSSFKAGDGLATFNGALGIARHAAVALDQAGEGLVSPVGGLDIPKLADALDLLLGQGFGRGEELRSPSRSPCERPSHPGDQDQSRPKGSNPGQTHGQRQRTGKGLGWMYFTGNG